MPLLVNPSALIESDAQLLPAVVTVLEQAGRHMSSLFEPRAGLLSVAQITAAIHQGDSAVLGIVRPLLEQVRPGVGWVDDELDGGELPDGQWWVVDPVEGAINFVHGIAEWSITATLVRDNEPVLTVVHNPLGGSTYTAVRGHGAFDNGQRISVSAKTELTAALAGTGQASPRETRATFELIGRTVPVMMGACGVIRVSVPPTLQLTHVAAGRMDLFWQHSAVRSGLLAGALLVTEAGGTVTDIHGEPWSLHSTDFLAAAPGVHRAASDTLVAAM